MIDGIAHGNILETGAPSCMCFLGHDILIQQHNSEPIPNQLSSTDAAVMEEEEASMMAVLLQDAVCVRWHGCVTTGRLYRIAPCDVCTCTVRYSDLETSPG